jgi:hypothetical protein
MFPGYLLSSYVLGVRWEDGVPINKKLLIEPHLGDLTTVEGKVVTESGVVPVSWKRDTIGDLAFTFTVPIGVKATLRVQAGPTGRFTLNSRSATGKLVGQRYQFTLTPGSYSGTAD